MRDLRAPAANNQGRDLLSEEIERHQLRVKRRHRVLGRVALAVVLLEGIYAAHLWLGSRLVTAAAVIVGAAVMALAIRRRPRPAAQPPVGAAATARPPARPRPPGPVPPPAPAPPPPAAPADGGRPRKQALHPRAGLPVLGGPHAVRVATVALVAAVALAVVAALAALAVAADRSGRPAAATAAAAADPGPGGFAADCVKLVLRAGEDKRAELTGCYGNRLPELAGVPSGSFDATSSTARQVTQLGPGYWSVLVAVDQVQRITNPTTGKSVWRAVGLRYYRLGVARRAGRLVAVDLPAAVAPPPVADPPDLAVAAVDQPNPADPRTDRLGRFFAAFLAGAGALDDSVLPGKRAAPIDPPPYTSTILRAVGYDTDPDQPAANARVVVAATTDAGNVQILGYSVRLVRRDGRWYVAGLDAAPALASR